MSLCSCHGFCKNLFQHGAFIERYLCLFPRRRPCLPVGGPSRRGSWGQEPTTWWLSLPSIPTVWASLSPQNSEPVSGKSQEDKCELRESTQKTSLYYHYVQGLYQGSPVYVWTRQGSSLCLWVGIGPRLPCKATDSPTDQEVRRTHTQRHTLILDPKPSGRSRCYCEWLSLWWGEKPFWPQKLFAFVSRWRSIFLCAVPSCTILLRMSLLWHGCWTFE